MNAHFGNERVRSTGSAYGHNEEPGSSASLRTNGKVECGMIAASPVQAVSTSIWNCQCAVRDDDYSTTKSIDGGAAEEGGVCKVELGEHLQKKEIHSSMESWEVAKLMIGRGY